MSKAHGCFSFDPEKFIGKEISPIHWKRFLKGKVRNNENATFPTSIPLREKEDLRLAEVESSVTEVESFGNTGFNDVGLRSDRIDG